MLSVFRDAEAEFEQRTVAARLAFYLREVTGLMLGAGRERMRELAACELKIGGIMDRGSECRFPRLAIVLMTIVFLIVVQLIAKGEGLSHYLFRMYTVSGQHVAGAPENWDLGTSFGHWPSHYGLLSGVAMMFVLAWAAGAAAWALAFLLRRTGAQRLEQSPISPASR